MESEFLRIFLLSRTGIELGALASDILKIMDLGAPNEGVVTRK